MAMSRKTTSNATKMKFRIRLIPRDASHVGDGEPLEEALIQDFIQDQPLNKFPYFTAGEVSAEQIRSFIAQCNEMTFTP